ncbi:MAG: hypothetical protein KAH21_01270 [Spirochaetaceae bacterium]|nr:hypothetical protein [Spirochaetaceae bacterium]
MLNWNARHCISVVIAVLVLSNFTHFLFADSVEGQIFSGIKISKPYESWRFSGEYQIRLEDNLRALDNHFLEFTGPYMPNHNWEIVPDFRMTMYPDRFEFRPGIGILYKFSWGKKIFIKQFINQLKWQTDFESTGVIKHGLRYALFYNQVLNKRFLFTSGAGVLYRWSDNFNGIQFIRMIAGLVYIFDSTHSLTMTPYLGLEDPTGNLTYTPGFVLVANIHLKGNSKYLPARYVTF